MINCNILFNNSGHALLANDVSFKINHFNESYIVATEDIIRDSKVLDPNGSVFYSCALRILSNFGMTRRGPFYGESKKEILIACWQAIGSELLEINQFIRSSGLSRDRFLLEVDDAQKEELIAKIWFMVKELLPFTMSRSTYGLVGASKILFSVLPELILPTDNNQWKQLFKTVDLGDVIRFMATDIKKWEAATNQHLNDLDSSRRLTTLPSIYNVIAMAARPIA